MSLLGFLNLSKFLPRLRWPQSKQSSSSEIKVLVERCSTCAEFLARNVSQPMQTHKISTFPWWPQICSLLVGRITSRLSTTSQILWKSLNSRALPRMQLFNQLFMSHPRQITRSRMVKRSLQRAFKKAERDGKDPWLALLDYKSTPTEGIGASPAQRFKSRRTRTLLPTASSLFRPEVSTHFTEKLEWKRRKAKFYHERHSKQLTELEIVKEVRIAPLRKNQTWKQATCVEKLSDM